MRQISDEVVSPCRGAVRRRPGCWVTPPRSRVRRSGRAFSQQPSGPRPVVSLLPQAVGLPLGSDVVQCLSILATWLHPLEERRVTFRTPIAWVAVAGKPLQIRHHRWRRLKPPVRPAHARACRLQDHPRPLRPAFTGASCSNLTATAASAQRRCTGVPSTPANSASTAPGSGTRQARPATAGKLACPPSWLLSMITNST